MLYCSRIPLLQRGSHGKTNSLQQTPENSCRPKASKDDLRKAIGAAPNTLTKLRRDEEVSMSVLIRICEYLDCDIGDIVSPEDVKERPPDGE